jgi:alkylation response protein AidB-like acyl-CoA dehydrogenase
MQETETMLAERQAPPGDDFLTPDELKALTPRDVIARTRALKDRLREKAQEAEANRRPDPALWSELRRSGFFYLLIPKKYGGLEASIDEVVDAGLPIAEGCASTGWLAMFGMMHNRHIVAFPERAQEEMFAGARYGIVASGTIPFGRAMRAPGGYRVSGRWQYATCIVQADWANVIAVVEGEEGPRGGPKVGSFLIPAAELEIIDTWKTDGMCATGTHDMVAKDAFVPEHRASSDLSRDGSGGGQRYENPIFRVPLSPLLAFTTTVPVVGAAKAAVALYRERLLNHAKRGTDNKESDRQSSQIRLARADTMVAVAEQTARSAMKENLTGVDLRGAEQAAFRSRLRAQMTFAAQLSRQAVITIAEATGTTIHYSDHALQRILRDMMVMTSHIIFDDDVVMEQHGRGMLGLAPNTMIS